MSYLRECLAEGCKTRVAPPRVFCSAHWKLVPDTLRQRIWAAVEGSVDQGMAEVDAREVVAAAEGRRAPSAFPDFQTEVVR